MCRRPPRGAGDAATANTAVSPGAAFTSVPPWGAPPENGAPQGWVLACRGLWALPCARAAGGSMEAFVDFGANPVALGTGLLLGSGSRVSPMGGHGWEGLRCLMPSAVSAQGGWLRSGTSGRRPSVGRCVTPAAEPSLIFGHGAGYWRPGPQQRGDSPPDNGSKGAAASIGSRLRHCLYIPRPAPGVRDGRMEPGRVLGLLLCVQLCGGECQGGGQLWGREPPPAPGWAQDPPCRRHRGGAAGGQR